MDSENRENNGEVYNHYLQLSLPTKEDLQRVFTDAELKELCLKHKCRVDVWRWNVVNDYRVAFTQSGRYQRWSERDRLRMLAKAVNKNKPDVLYDGEKILKEKKEQWDFQLKDNILSLNFWRRNELPSSSHRQVVSDSEDFAPEALSQLELNTESMNVNEMLTQSHSQNGPIGNEPAYEEFNQEVVTEIEVRTESMNDALSSDSDDDNLFGDVESVLIMEENSTDSVQTVLVNNYEKRQIQLQDVGGETLESEEVNPAIANLYDINSMSMTIDSQMSTQTQELPIQQSQDVIPASYDNFKNIIPSTSTQTQSQECSEDFVVVSSE